MNLKLWELMITKTCSNWRYLAKHWSQSGFESVHETNVFSFSFTKISLSSSGVWIKNLWIILLVWWFLFFLGKLLLISHSEFLCYRNDQQSDVWIMFMFPPFSCCFLELCLLKLSQELVCVVSVWACDMPLLLRDYYGEGERKWRML